MKKQKGKRVEEILFTGMSQGGKRNRVRTAVVKMVAK